MESRLENPVTVWNATYASTIILMGLTINERSAMSQKTIVDIAESFGLTVEVVTIPDHERAFRVFKGVNQVFIGTEDAVRNFFMDYEKERPALYKENIRGYKEWSPPRISALKFKPKWSATRQTDTNYDS